MQNADLKSIGELMGHTTTRTMGVVSLAALAVNVASAALLLPHRDGDANVRAVWLFQPQ